jgi:hypothetical protein
MSDKISFRLLNMSERNDFSAYVTLHKMIFPGCGFSPTAIQWYYNEIHRTRTYGAFENNKLIGIWSVEPRKLRLFSNQPPIAVGRAFATGIHPEYRRVGVFGRLSTFAIETERACREYEYVLGFPQSGRAVIGGHYKAGWYLVQPIDAYSINPLMCDIELIPHKLVTSMFSIKPLPNSLGTFADSIEFTHRRWITHPDRAYSVLTTQDDNGFIVLKPYGDKCHILELRGDVPKLLEIAKKTCNFHNWRALTIWCAFNDPFKYAVNAAGFCLNTEFTPSIELIAVNICENEKLALAQCHWQTGVEEPY